MVLIGLMIELIIGYFNILVVTFFKDNNIKLWLFYEEETIYPVVQRAAIEKNNGLTLYRQRSEGCGYPDGLGNSGAHIAFVFNRKAIHDMYLMRSRNILSIPVGYTFGSTKNVDFEESYTLRAELNNNGAKFVIAFLIMHVQ